MLLTEYDEKKQRKMLYRNAKAEGEQIGMAKGEQIGMAKGEQIGILVAKRQAVLEVLEIYGEVPEEIRSKIEKENDLDILSHWLQLAAKANDIKKFMDNIEVK